MQTAIENGDWAAVGATTAILATDSKEDDDDLTTSTSSEKCSIGMSEKSMIEEDIMNGEFLCIFRILPHETLACLTI